MAKSPEQKKAEADAKAAADAAIFGAPPATQPVDEVGVVQPAAEAGATPAAPAPVATPTPTAHSMPVQKEDSMSISRSQFEALMNRLNDLEGIALNSTRDGDDIFNPLAQAVTEHTVGLAFHGDDLVVGYKEKVRPDGKKTYTWHAKDKESGELRTMVTLLLKDSETGEIKEETVDYVGFIENAAIVPATIVERKDIGTLVEQGLTTQMTWNGRALVPTSTKIMTGAKEQKWLFTVKLNGENIQLPENVINIKA